jgi:hypothetical protein
MAKYAQKILFFFCYICKDYELKTSPHYRSQKRRFAKRRKAEQEAQPERRPAEQKRNTCPSKQAARNRKRDCHHHRPAPPSLFHLTRSLCFSLRDVAPEDQHVTLGL